MVTEAGSRVPNTLIAEGGVATPQPAHCRGWNENGSRHARRNIARLLQSSVTIVRGQTRHDQGRAWPLEGEQEAGTTSKDGGIGVGGCKRAVGQQG